MNPKFESPNTINSRFCFYYEMIFFLSGDVNYTIEDRHYKLRPGDLLLISKSDTKREFGYPPSSYSKE